MTFALCLECGHGKLGAWIACQKCGYQPAGAEELAKSLLISAQFLSMERLVEFSARRRGGEPWVWTTELLGKMTDTIARTIPLTPQGHPAAPPDGPNT